MSGKKSAQIFHLPIKSDTTSFEANTHAKLDSDEYNPMEAARFMSEISKVFGPYRTPAKVYEEIM